MATKFLSDMYKLVHKHKKLKAVDYYPSFF